ncbi:MAG: hypothetical protein B7Z25_06510 [Aerococcus viridans]|nr:MAG: hypothetical protein B7Z25_06510 [Aerococcus viridans]
MVKRHEHFVQQLINVLNIVGTVATIAFMIWAWHKGLLTDKQAFLDFMKQFGVTAPIVFVLIQFLQTVIPVIPGSVTIPLGVYMFGNVGGFMCNLLPIFLGSVFNFYLARRFGRSLVHILVGDKYYAKAIHWLEDRNRFERILILGLILPFMPADVVCYVAGLTNLSFKRFVQILAVGKPVTILIYSYATIFIIDLAGKFF